MKPTTLIIPAIAAIVVLTACTEKTATAPKLDSETQETISDIQNIMDGQGEVTFGDIMKIGRAAGNPDNQKKLVCVSLTATAQMAAMARESGMMVDVIEPNTIEAHLSNIAAQTLPDIEDQEISTENLQTAVAPIYNECMKYSMAVVTGQTPFKKGQY